MKKIIILLLMLLLSCKHMDKIDFAKKVLSNPNNIEQFLDDAPFTSVLFRNYFDYNKDYFIKRLNYINNLTKDGYELEFEGKYPKKYSLHFQGRTKVNVKITFHWDLINDKWDFSSINEEIIDSNFIKK